MISYILPAIAAMGLLGISLFNSLIAKRNQIANIYASLDAMLQKRYDLIPNLVATVRGAMTHERELFTQLVELRAAALSSTSARARLNCDDQLSATLNQLLVLSEDYPTLRTSANFLQLQAALNEVEEQISAARRAFNAAVTDYNNAVEMFPTNIIAEIMGFSKQPWYKIADEARHNVDIRGRLA